jgi:hypothetical protein
MFEDAFYPDNKNRVMRVVQLGTDCSELAAQLTEDKGRIDTLVKF